jgi:hypothetical protein
MIMNNSISCDMASFESCYNKYFGGTYLLLLQDGKHPQANSLVVIVEVHCSGILSALKIVTTRPSEMSVLSRLTRRHIPEDAILHNIGRATDESYIILTG